MPDVETELRRMRVLLVEDEEDALGLMARKFEWGDPGQHRGKGD